MINVAVDEQTYQTFLARLLAGEKQGCFDIVQKLLAGGVSLLQLYDHLFKRALYEVGYLWEVNRISVAVEHVASSIVESAMNLAYPALFATPRVGKRVVVSCLSNEYHQIGAKMVADMFEMKGWDSFFLGAGTRKEDLLSLVAAKRPDAVALSLTMPASLAPFLEVVDDVRTRFPKNRLIVGGQAFSRLDPACWQMLGGQQAVGDLTDLERILDGGRA